MLKNQIAIREQSFNEQLFPLEIKRVRRVNNSFNRSEFAANKQCLFQVSASVSCDSFGIENSFEAHFVIVLAQWLFACENPVLILRSWVLQSCG